MSEVANISEKQQNTVPVEQTVVEAETASTPASAETEAPTATEKQVVNNNIEAEAAAGDAGTSAEEAAKSAESSPKVESKKSPVKRTPSKRMSFIERAQKESEELVKNMGGSLELDGGRRTRSSARGTPTRATVVSTPPPAKKARTSPANASNTPSRARGRGRKIDISEDLEEAKSLAEPPSDKTPEKSKTPDKKSASAEKSNKVEDVSEPISEASAAADVAEKPADNKEAEIVASISNKEQSKDKKDKTDAQSNLEENILEEKPNDEPNATSEEAEKDAPVAQKNDETPMETEESLPAATTTASDPTAVVEPIQLDSAHDEKKAASTVATVPVTVPKPLSPEPMDVDSNSKSSDVQLIESVEPAAVEHSTETSASVSDAMEIIAPPAETPKVQEVEIVGTNTTVSGSTVKANNVDKSVTDILEVVPLESSPGEVGSVETNANALNITNELDADTKRDVVVVVAETAAVENEVNANNDESAKPGNNICVPKIVSSLINNANNEDTVTTIL